MKRRTEHLVEKRDGRREFLRATKLARSIHLALYEIGVDEDWRALELASVVLEGLRSKRGREVPVGAGIVAGKGGAEVVLTTSELADAVQHLLVVTGQPAAAVSYGAVRAERSRRRQSVATLAPPQQVSQSNPLANPLAGPRKSPKRSDRLGGRWAGEG
ncbi:MAG: hypothetical protein KAI24_23570 [Planctomycetes bacterium]|nr:hypothetical protein [Planctomycetota bacterium]